MVDKGIKVPDPRSGVGVGCWGSREIVREGYRPIFQIFFSAKNSTGATI